MLMSHLVSVVVCQFHVVSIAVDEPKADAALIVDGDGMLSLPLPCKFMKPVAGRNLQSQGKASGRGKGVREGSGLT